MYFVKQIFPQTFTLLSKVKDKVTSNIFSIIKVLIFNYFQNIPNKLNNNHYVKKYSYLSLITVVYNKFTSDCSIFYKTLNLKMFYTFSIHSYIFSIIKVLICNVFKLNIL